MRYFQAVRQRSQGPPVRVGGYRRPYDDEPRSDQIFNTINRTWVLSSDVSDASLGYRDEEFVEVTELEIRDFLEATFPDLDPDRILSAPLPERPAPVSDRSFPTKFEGGAHFVPIERAGVILGVLWWSDDDRAAGVEWRRAASREDVPLVQMEWWSRRLREARQADRAPSSFAETIVAEPAAESGILRRDLAGHVDTRAELRQV